MNLRSGLPFLVTGIVLLFSGAAPARAQPGAADYVPMKIDQTVTPTFPSSVYPLGLSHGEAHVAIQIDDAGRLTDYVVVAYSHPAFADAAVAALRQWKLEPAQLHGEARSATADLSFTFKAGVVVVDLTAFSGAELLHFQMMPDSMAFRARTLSQLDRIPTPVRIVRPSYPPSLARHNQTVRVTVHFYIDELGRVRLPAVSPEMNEASEELCAAAVMAVEQWRFEPPLAGGRAVLVMAQQDLDFKPSR